MRRNLDKIQIVEPPFEEFTKKYSRASSCRKGCCVGCFSIILFIAGAIVFLRLTMGQGPQTIKKVPNNFPKEIPVYDTDAIEKITFVSGKYKSRGVEIAAFFPKIILSPLLISMDKTPSASTSAKDKAVSSAKEMWKLITTPVGDHRDTVQIEWKNLSADPDFVASYYKTEFKKNGYEIEVESEGDKMQQFAFVKDKISGSFYAESEIHTRTDYALLTVNLPNSQTASN